MPKNQTIPNYDELTILSHYIIREYENPDDAVEQVMDLLIKAYRDGWDYFEYQMAMYGEFEPEVDIQSLQEALFKEYDGETFENRIREYTESGDVEAFEKVVLTEYHRMFNTGAEDHAVRFQNDIGKRVKKTWITMMDDRVRETHDYIHGISVDIEDRFYTFDGDSARFPGDFSDASNNIGCRCHLNYTMD